MFSGLSGIGSGSGNFTGRPRGFFSVIPLLSMEGGRLEWLRVPR